MIKTNINDRVRSLCWNAYSFYEENKDILSEEDIDNKLNPLRKTLIDLLSKSNIDTITLMNLEMEGYKLLVGEKF